MTAATPRLRLRLTPAAETAVRRGHPWVYGDRIREQNRAGASGEIAVVYDRRDRFFALGLFDPDSPIRLRVLHTGEPVAVNTDWWRARLDATLRRRDGLFDEQTTGWRALHGESDGWPGLVLDRYGDVAVLKVYSGAWLPRLAELVPLFVDRLRSRSLVLRLSRNLAVAAQRDHQCNDGMTLAGEPVSAPVIFLESGLRFEADVVRGQKTGFFLDQRDNRRLVGAAAAGADVLNAFSFSGGFSLYAAQGGARSVTDLDISPHALASAKRNFALNQHLPSVAAVRHETVQGDTFAWLAESRERSYDIVILDPPSLAKRETERPAAVAAYGRLAHLGIARTRPGGTLLAASCSAHVPAGEFFSVVRDAARQSGRRHEELRTTTHPADHPARFLEAHYLKAIYLRFS